MDAWARTDGSLSAADAAAARAAIGFVCASPTLKPAPDPALADEGSGRAKGDHDDGGEPPAPAFLANAAHAKEDQGEKADAMDRPEDVD